jgi:hypothetical protein
LSTKPSDLSHMFSNLKDLLPLRKSPKSWRKGNDPNKV